MPVVAELPPQPVYTEAPPAPQPQVHIAQPAPETAAEPATPMPWHTASLEEALAPTASPAAMAPAANNTLPPMVADFPATTQQAPVTEDSFGQAEPEALADSAPPAIPEMEPADATPVLPEETKKILDNAPKGLDTPKTTMKTPDPVVIRHTAPTAGTIPVVDVRAHEEMGLKIEVRKPNLNVQTYLELAYKNLMDGKTEIAAGYYREVLNVEPKNELALFGLATTYHKMGHTDEARDVYGQVLELNPTHREALNNFMALISEQTPEAAIAELEKLEQENPYFSPVTAQLGMTYKKVGKPREAVEKLLKALELSPDNISYKYNLAVTLDQMGERQQAADMYFELLEDYKTGVTIPGDIQAIRNRAIFLSSLS